MAKKLITLQEFNSLARKSYSFDDTPQPNGIACPKCGEELYDSCPNATLTSNPPQKNIHCEKCGYRGYRVC